MYQAPLCASISRSIGARVCSTVAGIGQQRAIGGQRAEVRERPPDVAGNDVEQRLGGRREEADIEVGVEEKRRDVGAVENFCRSLEVVRCRSRVSWSWLLRAVSSSLSDCNSSFEVSSSSLVDWYSSLTDNASSLIAFCSSFEISRLRMAPCSSALRGFEFLLEFGDPRSIRGRRRAAPAYALASARRRSRSAAAPRRRSEPAARRC